MCYLALFNFILHNLLQENIAQVVIFNCWHGKTIIPLAQKLNEHNIYAQNVKLPFIELDSSIEVKYFGTNKPNLAVFVDMQCKQSVELFKMASSLQLLNQNYHWLLYDAFGNMSFYQKLFAASNLAINTDLTYFLLHKKKHKAATYILYDVYNNGAHIGGKLNMTIDREILCNEQNCRVRRQLTQLRLKHKYDNRNSLADVTLHVATVITKRALNVTEAQLLEFLNSDFNVTDDNLMRFGFRLLLLLQDMLGFNITFVHKNVWSISEAAGGAVGALVDGSVDLSASPLLITAERLKYLTPLVETGAFRTVCIFRTPRNKSFQSGVFLEPFSAIIWFLFGLVLILTALVLWFIFFTERRCISSNNINFIPSFLSTFLITIGMACTQGSYLIPRTVGGRIAFLTLCLISFIMFNYYTSMIASSLLNSPNKSNIKTLRQLADSNLEIGIQPIPYTVVYLNVSQLPDVRLLVKKKIDTMLPKNVWMPLKNALERVRDDPGFVYIFDATIGYDLVNRYFELQEICDLNEILLRPDKSVYAQVKKNSTFKEILKIKLTKLRETGLYRKHFQYWMRTHLSCISNNFFIAVSMEYTAGQFLILIFGSLLAFLVLLLEICVKKYTTRKCAMQNKQTNSNIHFYVGNLSRKNWK